MARRIEGLGRPAEASGQQTTVGSVLGELRHGLLVAVGDVHVSEPTHLVRIEVTAALVGGIAEVLALADEVRVAGVGVDPHVPEVFSSTHLQGRRAPDAADPDGRVRSLQRDRPGIHAVELVVLPVPPERAWLGPRLPGERKTFCKPISCVGRPESEVVVLRSSADDESGFEPAPAEEVDHRVLLDRGEWGRSEGKRISEDGDPSPGRPLRDRRCHHVRTRHRAEGGLMVLVDRNPVES